MPYLSPMEKLAIEEGMQKGIEKGMKQGLLDAIDLGLDLKFGEDGLNLMPEIRELDDINVLKAIRSKIKPAKSLDELRQIYQK